VQRLLLCSGKVYYEPVARREKLGAAGRRTAIVRLEQLAPFPRDRLAQVLKEEVGWQALDAGSWSHINTTCFFYDSFQNAQPKKIKVISMYFTRF
jgi:2-oxoglutarate dehydrogenase complex dehydrogenase (E1) component-like enzyme